MNRCMNRMPKPCPKRELLRLQQTTDISLTAASVLEGRVTRRPSEGSSVFLETKWQTPPSLQTLNPKRMGGEEGERQTSSPRNPKQMPNMAASPEYRTGLPTLDSYCACFPESFGPESAQ